MLETINEMDGALLLAVQEYVRSDFLTPVMCFITSLGNYGLIWILISAVLLVNKKTRKTGVLSLAALGASHLINTVLLKAVFQRPRPYNVVPGLTLLARPERNTSFPSGHTASAFAAAVVLYRRLPKKAGIPFLILASLIAFSRIYVGAHYLTDVIAGVAGGCAVGCLTDIMERRISRKKKEVTD